MVLTEKVIKAEIGERKMVIGSWWCGGIGFVLRDFKHRLVCEATAKEMFRVLSFRVKIQDLALIGCTW
jgi:hypothetical protein